MTTQKSKIPKWKANQEKVAKSTFDDAFETLGASLSFIDEKKSKNGSKKKPEYSNVEK